MFNWQFNNSVHIYFNRFTIMQLYEYSPGSGLGPVGTFESPKFLLRFC